MSHVGKEGKTSGEGATSAAVVERKNEGLEMSSKEVGMGPRETGQHLKALALQV